MPLDRFPRGGLGETSLRVRLVDRMEELDRRACSTCQGSGLAQLAAWRPLDVTDRYQDVPDPRCHVQRPRKRYLTLVCVFGAVIVESA